MNNNMYLKHIIEKYNYNLLSLESEFTNLLEIRENQLE